MHPESPLRLSERGSGGWWWRNIIGFAILVEIIFLKLGIIVSGKPQGGGELQVGGGRLGELVVLVKRAVQIVEVLHCLLFHLDFLVQFLPQLLAVAACHSSQRQLFDGVVQGGSYFLVLIVDEVLDGTLLSPLLKSPRVDFQISTWHEGVHVNQLDLNIFSHCSQVESEFLFHLESAGVHALTHLLVLALARNLELGIYRAPILIYDVVNTLYEHNDLLTPSQCSCSSARALQLLIKLFYFSFLISQRVLNRINGLQSDS